MKKHVNTEEDKLDPVYKLLENLNNNKYDRQPVERELITKASAQEIEDRLPTTVLSTREYNGLRNGEGLLVRVGPHMILLKYEGRF